MEGKLAVRGRFNPEEDQALRILSLDGTCETTGDTTAYGIHVSLVSVESREYVEGATCLPPIGHYLVYEDALGFVHTVEYDTLRQAKEAFYQEERLFLDWLGEED